MSGADLATVGDFVEFPAVFVDGRHVHFADEEAWSDVDPDEGIVAEPYPRPADRLILSVAVGSPKIAVGNERVRDFMAAVGFGFAGLEVVARAPGTPEQRYSVPVSYQGR